MNGITTQPDARPRPLVLAHGSLRHAGFRDRVAAAAAAGFDGLGLHVREYARLRSQGWSDAGVRAVWADAGIGLVEIETMLGWESDVHDQLPPTAVAETLAAASRRVLQAAEPTALRPCD